MLDFLLFSLFFDSKKCADHLYASPRFTTNPKSFIETPAHMARRSNSFCCKARFIFEVVIR